MNKEPISWITKAKLFTTYPWWGKIIGACLGYLMARSVGAVFGLLIGNFFDRGLAEHFSRPHWPYHAEKRAAIQQLFLEATFKALGHVAKANGRVSSSSIQMAKTLMQEMGLSYRQKQTAQRYFNEGKQPSCDLTRLLILLHKSLQDNPELLRLFLDIQYRAAQVSGLSQPTLLAINRIFQQLGFSPLHEQHQYHDDFVQHHTRHQERATSGHQPNPGSNPHLSQAYAILGVPLVATRQEVKQAYRRAIGRNHPDKLIAKGLSEHLIKVANEKTQAICKAYETICESKGWK